MGWKVIACVVLIFALYYGYFLKETEVPIVDDDGWWGKGIKPTEELQNESYVRPFKVSTPDSVLEDLQKRLALARYGEDLENGDHHYGMQVKTMKKIVKYWTEEYNWRKQEDTINSFPQFKIKIEGIDIHFLRAAPQKSVGKVKPLLIVHGWPGSVWEFHKIIPLLTAEGFEVIAPSIPGYGWSEAPKQQGFDGSDAARVFQKLMQHLGFEKYYVQGGDWGALITTIMSQLYPQHVAGLHTNMPVPKTFSFNYYLHNVLHYFFPKISPSPMQRMLYYMTVEAGYFHIQATKPDTIGIALNDSPVGLAAYILEKFSTWTDPSYKDLPDGGLTEKYTYDELLTNVMIYWISQSAHSSCRFYKENAYSKTVLGLSNAPVKVPTGLAMFPHEIGYVTENMAKDKYHQLVQYTEMPRGGHFAAFEEPALLAEDIVKFVASLERRKA